MGIEKLRYLPEHRFHHPPYKNYNRKGGPPRPLFSYDAAKAPLRKTRKNRILCKNALPMEQDCRNRRAAPGEEATRQRQPSQAVQPAKRRLKGSHPERCRRHSANSPEMSIPAGNTKTTGRGIPLRLGIQ